jgi:endonuclease/exonuclease/phosphatase family metal-dependent hydrolase
VRITVPLLMLIGGCGSTPTSGGPDSRLLVTPPLVTCDPAASAPARVRVVTWNIDAAQTSSTGDIAAVLAGLDPDVVLLQEVDVNTQRSGVVDQPSVLAAALGEAYAFGEAIPWDGGVYGLALLSRLPFQAVTRISLDAPDASERRIGLETTLCFGPTAVTVVDTQADVVPSASAENAMDLLAALKPRIGQGLLLAGDFNALPTDPGPEAALAAGLADVVARTDTSPTADASRIDFVFADARLAPRFTSGQVVASDKSDHRPVLADFAGPF